MSGSVDLSRRLFLSATAIGGLASCVAGLGRPTSTTAPPITPTENDPLQLLDNAPWIPDGTPSTKQLYVIGAPWCPGCHTLFQSSRKWTREVQLRWIQLAPRDARSKMFVTQAGLFRDPGLLAAMYGSKSFINKPTNSAFESNLLSYLTALEAGINVPYFPYMICATKSGIFKGNWGTTIDPNVIQDRPQATHAQPNSPGMINVVYDRRPIPKTVLLAKSDGVPIYCLPHTGAISLSRFSKGASFTYVSSASYLGSRFMQMEQSKGMREVAPDLQDYVLADDLTT